MRQWMRFALLILITVAVGGAMTLPSVANIESPKIKNKPEKTRVIFKMQHKKEPLFRRVYLDWDNNPATGFSIDGIGADILLENASSYVYSGNGSTWLWMKQHDIKYKPKFGAAKWKVKYDQLPIAAGCVPTMKAVFQTENKKGKQKNSEIVNHALSCSTPVPTATVTATYTATLVPLTATPTATYTATLVPLTATPTATYTATKVPLTATPTATATITSTSTATATITSTPQMPNILLGRSLLIPAYFYLDEGMAIGCSGNEPDCGYARIIANGAAESVVIINPESGVGAAKSPEYVAQINALRAAGAAVIGYVGSDYGTRPLSQVVAEVNTYYSWYTLDGIFVDEMSSQNCDDLSYYQSIYNHIKSKGGKLVVGNAGTNTKACYMSAADVVITFECSNKPNAPICPINYKNWEPSGWTANYPAWRFAHLVYANTEAQLDKTLTRWAERNVGMIYVTDIGLPNPWEPLANYWESMVAWVQSH